MSLCDESLRASGDVVLEGFRSRVEAEASQASLRELWRIMVTVMDEDFEGC